MLNLCQTQSPATDKIVICVNHDIYIRHWIKVMGDRGCSTIGPFDLLDYWIAHMVLNRLLKLSRNPLIPIRCKAKVLLVF